MPGSAHNILSILFIVCTRPQQHNIHNGIETFACEMLTINLSTVSCIFDERKSSQVYDYDELPNY